MISSSKQQQKGGQVKKRPGVKHLAQKHQNIPQSLSEARMEA